MLVIGKIIKLNFFLIFKHNMDEFALDARILLIRNVLVSLIETAVDIELSDTNTDARAPLRSIINLLILHGRELASAPETRRDIKNHAFKLKRTQTCLTVFRMLFNIKQHRFSANMHFRQVKEHVPAALPVSIEARIMIETHLPQYRKARQSLKEPPVFKVDQIVGGRDSTNRWWLSRVLHVHNEPGTKIYWYYIHFEGWPKSSREWICSRSYSIRSYNPKKHILRR
jgi:hypothetical protein